MHAVSVEDFGSAIQAAEFEIIQFSGHGAKDGIILERGQLHEGELVGATRLAAILRTVSPKLRALVFMSCFSSSALEELATAAPFIITVTGEANDEACVEFAAAFYGYYFKSASVGGAFKVACDMLEYLGHGESLNPVLTRRSTSDGVDQKLLCAASFGLDDHDPLMIDISPVEKSIAALGIPRERFLSLLSRKIRIHRWIFDVPSERTLLSVGPYFGEFSWRSSDDPLVCHRILRLKQGTDASTCSVWAGLLLHYNELRAKPYRRARHPASPEFERSLSEAVKDLGDVLERYLSEREGAAQLEAAVPEQFKISKALVTANLQYADFARCRGDLVRLVSYLEACLTSVHDLVDALADALTEVAGVGGS
ncbi:MAG TPA: hypothetical protein VN999_18380 [Thermoanaerobaculia bacterium]|nr:hypothetical protein [Thermoanaerobaculia bacterium]